MNFNQTFEPHDLVRIAILVVLEAVLSIDNALVLGLLAKRLPQSQRAKALTLGLVGAFGFRFISIATAQALLTYTIVKLFGGLYLFYVALKYFWDQFRGSGSHDHASALAEGDTTQTDVDSPSHSPYDPESVAGDRSDVSRASLAPLTSQTPPAATIAAPAPFHAPPQYAAFWPTVFVIELTDIAFAVDSIVAAIGLVGPYSGPGWHPKLWVVVTGGMMGVVLMRYAATVFIRLLELFPRFETAAYLLVAVIGSKLVLDWAVNTPDHPHRLDFHNPTAFAFWAFWLVMLGSFCVGFIPPKKEKH